MEEQISIPEIIVGVVSLGFIIAIVVGLIKEHFETKVVIRDHDELYYCYGCRRKHTDNDGCD